MLPETSAPSVGAFEETFRRLSDDGADAIVCINLSARLSATMQSAQVAAKALDGTTPIEIIDSLSASMGIGNLVLHAARRAPRRRVARGDRERGRTRAASAQHVFAALDTLEYLRKGGRIGGAQAMLGSMLSIKPIISVHRRRGRAGGTGPHPLQGAALPRRPDPGRARSSTISVLHADAPDLDEFLAMLEPAVPDAEVTVGTIGPVIGVHTGPRVMGIAWIDRQE